MKSKLFAIFILFLSIFVISSASGEIKEIKVGIYDDPPAIYIESGKVKGYFHDIFDEIFKDTNYRLSYKYGTWAEILEWLKTGEVDMLFDIAPTKERMSEYDFNQETIFLSWGVIYGSTDIKVTSLFDLKNLRIAVVDEDVYYEGNEDAIKEVLAALDIRPRFIETGDYTEAIEKVALGEADVCVIPREFADFVLKDRREFMQTPIIFNPTPIKVGFKKDSALAKELIPFIDNILAKEKMNPDSFYFEAINTYTANRVIYKDNIVIEKVIDYKILSIILIPSIFILVLLYNLSLRRKIKIITSDLVKINKELKETSIKDHLTTLYNRRYFEENFEKEITNAQQYSRSLSFIILDIDFFKKVNDKYGHLVGDQVIKKVASILIENFRVDDIICRYGGEEFAILLPRLNIEQAYIAAEELRKTIENTEFENMTEKITVTCGISEYSAVINNMDKIVSIADNALYEGKANGRNQVVFYKTFEDNKRDQE